MLQRYISFQQMLSLTLSTHSSGGSTVRYETEFTEFTDARNASDSADISKHRLSPYIIYYHHDKLQDYAAPDSDAVERCFLKVLIV